jgi:hypothetical protein
LGSIYVQGAGSSPDFSNADRREVACVIAIWPKHVLMRIIQIASGPFDFVPRRGTHFAYLERIVERHSGEGMVGVDKNVVSSYLEDFHRKAITIGGFCLKFVALDQLEIG